MSLTYVALGAVIGLIGTLVGAGGGFLAVPILVIFFHANPTTVAGTSLIMVTVNALVGAASYWRLRRIDFQMAALLIAGSIPGTVLGAVLGPRVPAQQFRLSFGLVLLALAGWTVYKAVAPTRTVAEDQSLGRCPEPRTWRCAERSILVADGTIYRYTLTRPVTITLSSVIGFLGALLGIGGGPLLVPALLYGLHVPLPIATATSQVMIAVSSFGAAAIYLAGGHADLGQALALSLGTVVGAPAGAWLSQKINGKWIVLMLAGFLAFVGLRLIV